jgi:hypothetical protein
MYTLFVFAALLIAFIVVGAAWSIPDDEQVEAIREIPVNKKKKKRGGYIEAWIPIIAETLNLRIWLRDTKDRYPVPEKQYPEGHLVRSEDVNTWRVPIVPETNDLIEWLEDNDPHYMASEELKAAYAKLDVRFAGIEAPPTDEDTEEIEVKL